MTVLGEAVLVAAAKAASGLAVQASQPLWKALLQRIRPTPRVVRKLPAWKSTKLSERQLQQAQKYLNSRIYTGLVQILTWVVFNELGEEREDQKKDLRATFEREFLRAVDGEESELLNLAGELWDSTESLIELYVSKIEAADQSLDRKLDINTLVSRRMPLVVPEKARRDSEPQKRKRPPTAMAVVGERAQIMDSIAHSAGLARIVENVRRSAADLYSSLHMPHSRDLHRVPIGDIYVQRHVVSMPADEFASGRGLSAVRITGAMQRQDREGSSLSVLEDDLDDRRYVLIGNPGAGKSTFVRHLMYRTASSVDASDVVPFILELKSYPFAQPKSIPDLLAERLRVVDHIEATIHEINDILTLGCAVVIFDGLDEIIDLSKRRQAVEAIESFCRRYPLVQVIATSREEGYVGASLHPNLFSSYRIPDFKEEQVEEYTNRWFAVAVSPGEEPPHEQAKNFMRDSSHARDLRCNPLMLSLLCMLYKYDGYIPENRPRVYEECSELLFDRWDRVKHVPQVLSPEARSKLLVQELAYFFFANQARQGGVEEYVVFRVLREYLVRNVIADETIAEQRAREFLDYCAGRAWLLTKVGTSERGQRLFGFTHRTFLEYFVACYLVRQHSSTEDLVNALSQFIREGSSDVIPQIAIQRHDELVADGAENFLLLLLFDSVSLIRSVRAEFLPFALRTVRYMRLAPHALKKIYEAALRQYGITRSDELIQLMAYARGDSRIVLRQICEEVGKVDPGHDKQKLILQNSCYALLCSLDSQWAKDLANRLQANIVAGSAALTKSDPDILFRLVDAEALPIEEFIKMAPAHYLIGLRVARPQSRAFISGPLSIELARVVNGREAKPRLRKMLTLLFGNPAIIFPMPKDAAMQLHALVEDLEIEDLARILEETPRRVRPALRGMIMAAIIIDVELDTGSSLEATRWMLSKKAALRLGNGLGAARNETYRIDDEVVEIIRQLKLDASWVDWIQQWAAAECAAIGVTRYVDDDEI